jgi:hypothetical protein
MPSINLTFKNNKEEIDLYEWICKSTTGKSGFIKDILKREKQRLEMPKDQKVMKGFFTME